MKMTYDSDSIDGGQCKDEAWCWKLMWTAIILAVVFLILKIIMG